jgi:hypothetical protein
MADKGVPVLAAADGVATWVGTGWYWLVEFVAHRVKPLHARVG